MAAKLKGYLRWTLVRWIDEEKIGIMPASYVATGYTATVGAIVPMKWYGGTATYDVEILKMSG